MALTTPSGKGIEKVAKRFCVETAVYWGNPQNDGYGGFTFDTPVEIKCRWEEKSEVDIGCLLYTSDAADDLLCVDLGGRSIIKKKKEKTS